MLKKSLLTLAAIFFIACCLMPNPVYAGWHEWSQNARNQAILNEAYRDINKPVGLSCKEWAKKVVKSASNGLVSLPATTDTYPWYYWKPSKDVLSRSGRIESVVPGEIVQMYTIYNSPHTAIVCGISKSGVTFIECNWCANNCQIVKKRDVDFASFYKEVPCATFTINTIL